VTYKLSVKAHRQECLWHKWKRHRWRGPLTQSTRTGPDWAQPAVHNFGFLNPAFETGFSHFEVATLCRLGFGFGLAWRLGGPWATQASPKGSRKRRMGEVLLFATKLEKGRVPLHEDRAWSLASWLERPSADSWVSSTPSRENRACRGPVIG